MRELPIVFISAVAQTGLNELKDVLWQELNSESNKLQTITAEDSLVHRDKEMSQFARELMDEGENVDIPDDDEEVEDDFEILDDYEIEDFDE